MSKLAALSMLFLAAVLEAGGDAMVRGGLRHTVPTARIALLLGGAVVLFVYGLCVNAPPWDFGRLLGLYVVFFFVVAQMISWVVFHQAPSVSILAGGGLIVAGGLVVFLGSS